MNFKPFRLLLPLRSPVVLTAFAPTLDGILFESLSQRFCSDTPEQIVNRLKTLLAFHEEWQVFHASSLRFGVNAQSGLIASDYHRPDVLHSGKRSSDMFEGHGRKGAYPKLVIAGGPTKKRMSSRPSYIAQFACFDGHGDVQAIVNLLANTFVGVGYDAQNSGMGQFDTKHIEIITLDADESLVVNGKAMRQLPAGAANGLSVMTRMLPPYYLKDNQIQAVTPPRVQLVNIDLI